MSTVILHIKITGSTPDVLDLTNDIRNSLNERTPQIYVEEIVDLEEGGWYDIWGDES